MAARDTRRIKAHKGETGKMSNVMSFTVSNLARSLADYLAPLLPSITFYQDPAQQGAKTPCAFLQTRHTQTERRQADRWLYTLRLDLVFLEDYNLPDLQRRYQAIAEKLDQNLELFPYSNDGGETSTLLRTYRREWDIRLTELHYKFELRLFVEKLEEEIKMRIMDYYEVIKNAE